MKKKILIILSVVIIILLLSNVIAYAFLNKDLYQFFFANDDNNQQKVTNNLLIKDNQKIEIDNYVITLEESLCEKNTQLGYLVFSICDKDGNKVDADINKYNKVIKSFGENERFVFEYEATGTMNKYAEYVGNTLYVYISFEIDSHVIDENKNLNECIKITDTEESVDDKTNQYTFNFNFSNNCRKFKYNDGTLYVSPLGVKFTTDKVMDNLNITINDKDDNIIKNLNNGENSFSKSGCKDNGVTKVQYTDQFDELLNIDSIKNVYINEKKLEEIK